MSSLPVHAMSRLMKNWRGRALDGPGTLRLLNEGGRQQPLLWILNAAADTHHLEAAFGLDQPVIYGRSLHLLVSEGEDRLGPAQSVADHYTKTLAQHVSPGRIWLGSNCQGNEIVRAWLPRLAAAQFDVAGLCFVNNPVNADATGRPALLIYGDQDDRHNPFAQDEPAATARAQAAFSSYERRMVAAGHGQFFSPPVVFEIAEQMRAFWQAHPPTPDASQPAQIIPASPSRAL
mgnify:CR=1 FL=1